MPTNHCRLNCFPLHSNTGVHIGLFTICISRFHWRCFVLQAKYIIYVADETFRCLEAELYFSAFNVHNEDLMEVQHPLFSSLLRFCLFSHISGFVSTFSATSMSTAYIDSCLLQYVSIQHLN